MRFSKSNFKVDQSYLLNQAWVRFYFSLKTCFHNILVACLRGSTILNKTNDRSSQSWYLHTTNCRPYFWYHPLRRRRCRYRFLLIQVKIFKLDFYFSERPPEKVASELTDDQREAELMKKKGNEQFVEKNLNLALEFYQKAVELGEQTNNLTVI